MIIKSIVLENFHKNTFLLFSFKKTFDLKNYLCEV